MALPFNLFPRLVTPRLLGIDIGAGGIRVIEFSRKGKASRVEHFAYQPLPAGAMRDASLAEFSQVVDALRQAIKNSGSKAQHAALALPSSSVITKTIVLPDFLSDDELAMQVEVEASQSLPFAREEISLDFFVIGKSPASPDSIELMLVAAKKEKIDERLALSESAGIKAVAMDIESYAARAALSVMIEAEQRRHVQPVVLLQVGFENTSFSVLSNDMLLHEREFAFGSQKLEHDLARDNSDAQYMIVDTFNKMLVQEIARALQIFFTSTAYGAIGHIYLAGASPYLSRLPPVVEAQVGVGATLVNPFSGMAISSSVNQEIIQAHATASLVAAGLALRRFD